MNLDNLRATLRNMGQEIAEQYKQNLLAHEHYKTGALYESVQPIVDETDDTLTLGIDALDYWRYVEKYDHDLEAAVDDVLSRWDGILERDLAEALE